MGQRSPCDQRADMIKPSRSLFPQDWPKPWYSDGWQILLVLLAAAWMLTAVIAVIPWNRFSISDWYAGQPGNNLLTGIGATATFIATAVALWMSNKETRRLDASAQAAAAIAGASIKYKLATVLGLAEVAYGECMRGQAISEFEMLKRLRSEMSRAYPSIDRDAVWMLAPLGNFAAMRLSKGLSAIDLLQSEIGVMASFIGPNFPFGGAEWTQSKVTLLGSAVSDLRVAQDEIRGVTEG